MYYCARCQGILTDKQTILPGDKEGESMHYACAYKMWQERLKKQEEELFKQMKERRKFLEEP